MAVWSIGVENRAGRARVVRNGFVPIPFQSAYRKRPLLEKWCLLSCISSDIIAFLLTLPETLYATLGALTAHGRTLINIGLHLN